jgi:glycosyltransferase involved in cell wall biosynthesis
MKYNKYNNLLSVIVPCFNEENNVRYIYNRIIDSINASASYNTVIRMVFVDNASTDKTVEIVRALQSQDPQVRLIRNSRNVGPNRSVWNALRLVSGDAVVYCLPADGQDPPELLRDMVDHWLSGREVVCGVRAHRPGDRLAVVRWLFALYSRAVCGFVMPLGLGDFQLVDRRVVDVMLRTPGGFRFPRVLAPQISKEVVFLPYSWGARHAGTSKSDVWHLLDNASAVSGLARARTMSVAILSSVFSFLAWIVRRRWVLRSRRLRVTASVALAGVVVGSGNLSLMLLMFVIRETWLRFTYGSDPQVSSTHDLNSPVADGDRCR